VFSNRRNDGPNISEDLRNLKGAEGSQDFHAQLLDAQVPFGLIVGEGNCEVRKEPQDVVTVVAQADQKVLAWQLGFSASRAGAPRQGVVSLMEGEALGEGRHVFDEDGVVNRRLALMR
jgi:hypothetical protein